MLRARGQSTAVLQQQHVDRLHRHTIHTTSAAHGNGPTARCHFSTCPFTFSQLQRSVCTLLLLFLTFSVLVANPKKLLYTVANPARGLLNREKRTKEKVWQHTPPPTPHTARSEKINKITRRIYRRYAGGRSRVRTRIPSARRLGLWVWLRNSTLPSAIIRFPVSLLLSSPGDV